jgi:iron-sulfur cluster assembly protein
MSMIGVTLTERAAAHVRRFLAAKAADGLRLGVKKTGCSGLAYTVEPAAGINPGDQVFESQGVRLIVSAENLPFLAGMEVDYAREGLNESFRFSNPNAKAMCGCGESFTV